MIDQLKLLPSYLYGHINLTLTALIVGIVISIPLGILASRVRSVERIALFLTGIVQTIPSLALLAAMVPLLALLEVPSIGYLPAFIALVLYCMLPMVRNTVVGIRAVDPALIEAAKGIGMTNFQRLIRVELPVSAPMIIAGIRTSTAWTVGTATLSTAVGAVSLGNYIFTGLQTRNTTAILTGCFFAALLALVLDGIIRILATSLEKNRRVLFASIILAFVAFCTCSAYDAMKVFLRKEERAIQVGAKAFTEQYVISEIIAQKIEENTSAEAEIRSSLGTSSAFSALIASDLDIYVEYSGTIWTHLMQNHEPPQSEEVLLESITSFLNQHNVTAIGALGFNNMYALAMMPARAKELGISKMSDLARHRHLKIAADYEFFVRPEWQTLESAYGFSFAQEIPMDHGIMYQAITDGSVDVVVAFTTDGHLDANNLIILDDDRHASLSYSAIILASPKLSKTRPHVLSSLKKLIGSIDEPRMRRLNSLVDNEGRSPTEVAKLFLASPERI